MTSLPITNKAMRDAVVAQMRELESTSTEVKGAEGRRMRLKSRCRLSRRLPVWTLAVCPICDTPYRHRIDPFGFDGPWWDDNLNPNVDNCEHARVIRSAHHGYGMMEPRYQRTYPDWSAAPLCDPLSYGPGANDSSGLSPSISLWRYPLRHCLLLRTGA